MIPVLSLQSEGEEFEEYFFQILPGVHLLSIPMDGFISFPQHFRVKQGEGSHSQQEKGVLSFLELSLGKEMQLAVMAVGG